MVEGVGLLLFCDIDAFVIVIWYEWYLYFWFMLVEDIVDVCCYDFYVLCGIEILFEVDGVCFSEYIWFWM